MTTVRVYDGRVAFPIAGDLITLREFPTLAAALAWIEHMGADGVTYVIH